MCGVCYLHYCLIIAAIGILQTLKYWTGRRNFVKKESLFTSSQYCDAAAVFVLLH